MLPSIILILSLVAFLVTVIVLRKRPKVVNIQEVLDSYLKETFGDDSKLPLVLVRIEETLEAGNPIEHVFYQYEPGTFGRAVTLQVCLNKGLLAEDTFEHFLQEHCRRTLLKSLERLWPKFPNNVLLTGSMELMLQIDTTKGSDPLLHRLGGLNLLPDLTPHGFGR